MISIVIPAYNEEAVIERCLRGLTQGAAPGELEIIVACNGCRDRTAAIARAFGEPVRVVETSRASKIEALNLGDQAARGFPRCFIDADVEVGIAQVRQVADLLRSGRALAAAPAMRVDLSHSDVWVRAYYTIWLRQPYHRPGMIGGGFYALSAAGRARFAHFPDVIADDEFVRRLFAHHERATPPNCTFTIRAPHTLADLIKVKTRSRLGLLELRRTFPSQRPPPAPSGQRVPGWMIRPWLWPYAAIYTGVSITTRLRAADQWTHIETYQWERDESSRQLRAPHTT